MVGKNNFANKMQAEAERRPHYGIRKFSIGVASVLLSTSLYFGIASLNSNNVLADTQNETETVSQDVSDTAKVEKPEETNEFKQDVNNEKAAAVEETSVNNSSKIENGGVQHSTNEFTPNKGKAVYTERAVSANLQSDTQHQTVTKTQTIHYVDEQGNKIADDNVQSLKFYPVVVEDGLNHRDQTDIYRSTYTREKMTDSDGTDKWVGIYRIHWRKRITHYRFPEGDLERVTYSPKWQSVKSTTIPDGEDESKWDIVKGADLIKGEAEGTDKVSFDPVSSPATITKNGVIYRLKNAGQATIAGTSGSEESLPDNKQINVVYVKVPQEQNGKISYIENGTNNEVGNTSLKGKTGENVQVASKVKAPVGWKIVSGQNIPATVPATENGISTVKVMVEHATTTVTPDKPKTPNDTLPDNPGKKYPTGVNHDDLNKTITRTITVTKPDGSKVPTEQKATITRTATVDEVTGKVTGYSPWKNSSWPEFKDIPSVPGYTPTKSLVPVKDVNENTGNETVNITYNPNDQRGKISYVENGTTHEVANTPLNGKTDQTVTITKHIPAGWKEVPGQNIPTSETATANGIPTVTVKIEHATTTVTPDKPKTPTDTLPDNPGKKYPTGVGHDDLNKTVTRTITVIKPDGTKKSTPQTATVTRIATVDEVTGKVTGYSPWKNSSWSEFKDIPTVPGYTPTKSSVPAKTVDEKTGNETVNITYTPNKQNGDITYIDVDDGNKVISRQPISGNTDTNVPIKTDPKRIPAGYELVPNQNIPTTVPATPDGIKDVPVKVQHKTVTVDPNNPTPKPGDKLPDNPGKKFPDGVSTDNLTKTITRTITVTKPDKSKKTTEQTVKLTHKAIVDEVTGQVKSYTDWTKGNWDEFTDIPKVPGYTPTKSKVDTQTVTSDTKDSTVNITYTPNDQIGKISYVDKDGKEVTSTPLNGKTDEKVPVNPQIPAGWKKVDGQNIPTTETATPNGIPTVTVKIEHATTTVTPDKPKTPDDTLPDNPGKKYPTGVGHDDLNKTVTRTVNITDPHTGKHTKTQSVTFTHTATVDEVTGKVISNGDWSENDSHEFTGVTVPTVPGYTASGSVDKLTVHHDSKDSTVDITYTPNDQIGKISYVDKDGKEVANTPLNGKTDKEVSINPQIPAGWEKVPGQTIPTTETATPTGIPTVTVEIEHKIVKVPHDDPKTPKDKLPDNPTVNYPSGVDKDSLNKTVKRTVNITDPHTRKTSTTTQTVTFTRDATVDEVSGDKTYTDWSEKDTHTFDKVTVPDVPGYTPSGDAPSEVVNHKSESSIIDITYKPNDQHGKISYIDKDGKEVGSTPLNGKTDETVPINPQIPAGWKKVDGQTIPKTKTATPTGIPTVTVKIEHAKVTVPHTNPKTPKDKLPDNPTVNYPSGVDKDSLNKTVTRIVNITDPHTGKITRTTQTVTFTRDATVDEVTGDKTYTPWSDKDTHTFESVPVPHISGYTPSGDVPSEVVNHESDSSKVSITYTPNDQNGEITYIDVNNGNKVIKSESITGKTDESIKIEPKIPAGYELVPNQNIPEKETATPNGIPNVPIKIQHKLVTVDPNNKDPKNPTPKPGAPLPNNPEKKFPDGVSTDNLTKTITRTITVNKPGEAPTKVTQTAKLTRKAIVDEVTGEVKTYTDWSTGKWDDYKAPEVKGYTPTVPDVPEQDIDINTSSTNVTIDYNKDGVPTQHKTGQIIYIDKNDTDKVIKTETVTGKVGEKVTITKNIPDGYEEVPNQNIPTTEDVTIDGIPTVKIKLQHKVITVTPEDPKTPDSKLPDNKKVNYPSGVGQNDLNKTITRTITVIKPDGTKELTEQKATLTRKATVDEVTGKVVKYSDWTTGNWDKFTTPTVEGYQPTIKSVAAQKVDYATQDSLITIGYNKDGETPKNQTGLIVYKDKDDHDKIIKTNTITGEVGSKVEIHTHIPDGYEVVNPKDIPTDVTVTKDPIPTITIELTHKTVEVTPEDPKTPSDNLPDNPSQTYPTGVGQTDLNKTVTRTIIVTDKNGATSSVIKQTAKLTRKATVDEVTGKVTGYTPWSNGSWNEFTEIPAISGYTPSQTSVPAKTNVDDKTNDETVVVSYKPDVQVAHLNFVDDTTGATLSNKESVAGHSDDGPISFANGQKALQDYINKGYEFVKVSNDNTHKDLDGNNYEEAAANFGFFDHVDDEAQNFTVHLKHGKATVDSKHPQKSGDPINPDDPKGAKYPKDVDTLSHDVKRTIKYQFGDGTEAAKSVEGKLHFERKLEIDKVTGKVIKDTWDGPYDFDDVKSPDVSGFTPDKAKVSNKDVKHDDKDIVVKVVYTANPADDSSETKSKPGDKKKEAPKEKKSETKKKVNKKRGKKTTKRSRKNVKKSSKRAARKHYSENYGSKAQNLNERNRKHSNANTMPLSSNSKNVSSENIKAKQELPQTGEKQDQLGVIGLALASIAGFLGLASDRKRKN